MPAGIGGRGPIVMMVIAGIAAGVGVLVIAAHLLAAYALARRMTRIKRVRVSGSPADLYLDHEDLTFPAADGLALRGWYLANPGAHASVVIVHDDVGNRSDPGIGLLELQRDYVRSGLNVVSFDLRGRGESSGQRNQLGAGEIADVIGAVRYARHRSDVPVVLHGFGTGATLALSAAASQDGVAAVVADSPWVSMRDRVRVRYEHVPAHIFALATALAHWRFGAELDAVMPARSMHELEETSVLYVHSENNRETPLEHTLNLAAASLNDADEIWMPYEGTHRGAYRTDPADYMHRCLQFINRAIPARVPAVRAV